MIWDKLSFRLEKCRDIEFEISEKDMLFFTKISSYDDCESEEISLLELADLIENKKIYLKNKEKITKKITTELESKYKEQIEAFKKEIRELKSSLKDWRKYEQEAIDNSKEWKIHANELKKELDKKNRMVESLQELIELKTKDNVKKPRISEETNYKGGLK